MCRPQRPEGEEAAEKAPAEAENQGPPNYVAAAVRQPPCHDRGQRYEGKCDNTEWLSGS